MPESDVSANAAAEVGQVAKTLLNDWGPLWLVLALFFAILAYRSPDLLRELFAGWNLTRKTNAALKQKQAALKNASERKPKGKGQ